MHVIIHGLQMSMDICNWTPNKILQTFLPSTFKLFTKKKSWGIHAEIKLHYYLFGYALQSVSYIISPLNATSQVANLNQINCRLRQLLFIIKPLQVGYIIVWCWAQIGTNLLKKIDSLKYIYNFIYIFHAHKNLVNFAVSHFQQLGFSGSCQLTYIHSI